MPRTDDGEFELVLGNKQLLSVFFIVVILLGVFFTMGYITGKSAAAGVADAAKKTDATRSIVVDSGQRTSPMPDASAQQAPAAAASTPDTATGTQPVATAPQQPQETAQSAPAEPAASAAKPPREAESPGKPALAEPPAGTVFLQVVATARPEAEVIGGTLSKRGYKTRLSLAPNGAFRVLVGPLKDASEIASTRADLEKAGFKPIVRRF